MKTKAGGVGGAIEVAEIEQVESVQAGVEEILPLSPLQEGLLFHALYDVAARDVYTVQLVLGLEGPLEEEALQAAAAAALLRRHGNLRAFFLHEELSQPVQVILAEVRVPWQSIDLSRLPVEERQQRWEQIRSEDAQERFDLGRAPLLRFTLVQMGEQQYRLLFTNHHLLLDGWSMPVLLRELFVLYAQRGSDRGLAPVTPYREYLGWLARQDKQAAAQAWSEALSGLEEGTRLAPAVRIGSEAIFAEPVRVELSEALTQQLIRQARSQGLTLNTLLQGAWGALLGRLTGREDVVFGITVAGRPAEIAGIEQMVGLFINTLPVRVQLAGWEGVRGWLAGLQEQQSRLMAHQHLELVEIQRLAGLGDLFDTLMVFENYPVERSALAQVEVGLRVSSVEGRDATHYPLTLVVMPGARLQMRWQYRGDLFDRVSVERLAERLERLLAGLAADVEQPLGRIELLSAEERSQILREWNDTAVSVPGSSLPELFEAQVERSPQAVAVIFEGEELSYAELNGRANQLARSLRDEGIGPEDVVALALPRSLEMVVSLLGIVKSGAAYLPLDPEYPQERLQFMLEDAQPALLLTTSELGERLPETGCVRWRMDEKQTRAALSAQPQSNLSQQQRSQPLLPQHPAYVIYTSGSTGTPKGVVVPQAGVPNLAAAQVKQFAVGPESRVLQLASPSFDAAVMEVLMAWAAGAALVIPQPGPIVGEPLAELLRSARVSHALIPPTVLGSLEGESLGE